MLCCSKASCDAISSTLPRGLHLHTQKHTHTHANKNTSRDECIQIHSPTLSVCEHTSAFGHVSAHARTQNDAPTDGYPNTLSPLSLSMTHDHTSFDMYTHSDTSSLPCAHTKTHMHARAHTRSDRVAVGRLSGDVRQSLDPLAPS